MTSISVPRYPNADDMLVAFFTLRGQRVQGRRARRLADAERALRQCCETHLGRYLYDAERFIVAAERQLDPIDAATRLVNPELLLSVIPHFVLEPEWAGADLEDRRVRIDEARRLRDFVIGFPPLNDMDGGPEDVAIMFALWNARADLGRARKARREAA